LVNEEEMEKKEKRDFHGNLFFLYKPHTHTHYMVGGLYL
jgi:hypothetical protein